MFLPHRRAAELSNVPSPLMGEGWDGGDRPRRPYVQHPQHFHEGVRRFKKGLARPTYLVAYPSTLCYIRYN